MKKDFFEWLFKALKIDVNNTSKSGWKSSRIRLKNVNRYTRAGKNGKIIICPVCGEPEVVYHFSWAAMTCPSCNTSSNKNNWLVGV
jgi:rubrerythrin